MIRSNSKPWRRCSGRIAPQIDHCASVRSKANLGHLESASGIAGLIKVVLSMGHEEIPRQLHFRKLNPRISFGSAPIEIPVNAIAWPRSERPRIAGVSSFGFSGTNAHVILQEAPTAKESARPHRSPDRSAHLMVLSASSEAALRDLSLAYAEHLAKERCTARCRISVTRRRLDAQPFLTAWRFLLRTSPWQGNYSALSRRGSQNPRSSQVAFAPIPESRFSSPGKGRNIRAWDEICIELSPCSAMLSIKCALLLGEQLDRPLKEIVGYDTNDSAPAGILDETGIHTAGTLRFRIRAGVAVAFVGYRARGNRGTQSGRICWRLCCRRTQSGRRIAFGSHEIAPYAVAAAKRCDGRGVCRRRPGARGDRALYQIPFPSLLPIHR